MEAFVVCEDFSPPKDFVPLPLSNPLLDHHYSEQGGKNELVGINRMIVPFLACGDLSGFDSDQSYPLPNSNPRLSSSEQSLIDDYKYHEPAQKPINPPYQEYLDRKGTGFGGAYARWESIDRNGRHTLPKNMNLQKHR